MKVYISLCFLYTFESLYYFKNYVIERYIVKNSVCFLVHEGSNMYSVKFHLSN